MADSRPLSVLAGVLLAGAAFAQTPDSTMKRVVDGYRFELTVMGAAEDRKQHAATIRRRIVVRAVERSVGHPVPLRAPVLQVARLKGEADIYPLHQVDPRGDPAYEATVELRHRAPHSLVVLAQPSGTEHLLRATFHYRHR